MLRNFHIGRLGLVALKPEYMNYDESYSLAKKCIHALADINTDYSREKLELLAMSDVAIISEKAKEKLQKRHGL